MLHSQTPPTIIDWCKDNNIEDNYASRYISFIEENGHLFNYGELNRASFLINQIIEFANQKCINIHFKTTE